MSSKKPSESEEEYFARQDFERKKLWEQERAMKLEAEEKIRLRELHHMKCPQCGLDLQPFEFKGIKLDRCASCNGTWFDGGEMEEMLTQDKGVLDKLKGIFG